MKKCHKNISVIVLFAFCYQLFFAVHITYASNTNQAFSGIVNDQTKEIPLSGAVLEKKQLAAAYIDYLVDMIPHYQKLRSLHQGINALLLQETVWSELALSGEVDSDIIDQGHQTLNYLVSTIIPGEKRLHEGQVELERKILQHDGLKYASPGALKDARNLAYLYELHGQLQDAKLQNLGLNNDMLEDLFSNASANSVGFTESRLSSAKHRVATYGNLLTGIQEEETQIADLKADFSRKKSEFNHKIARRAQLEKQRIDALIDEIRIQIKTLKTDGGENQTYHADLLTEIVQQLNRKKGKISERLLELDDRYRDRGGNFLYIPENLGNHSTTAPLVSRYQNLSKTLVERTLDRKKVVESLTLAVEAIESILTLEATHTHTIFEELKASSQSPFLEMITEVGRTYSTVAEDYVLTRQALKNILSDFDVIEHHIAEDITKNVNLSWTIIRLNQSIEAAINRLDRLMPAAMILDVQLATIIRGAAKYQPELNKAIDQLIATSEDRNRLIGSAGTSVTHLKDTYNDDYLTTVELRSLGADILMAFQTEYTTALPIMAASINKEPFDSKRSYYNYLNDVYRLLEDRSELNGRIISKFPENGQFSEPDCPGCQEEQRLWRQTAHLDRSYVDALEHIENLSEIKDYFNLGRSQPETLFQETSNLFHLSTLLKTPVFLTLKNDSIDIVFVTQKGSLTLAGIGNPDKLNLAETIMGSISDYFVNPPYIGQGFNPAAAWDSFTDKISDSASGFGDTVSDTASDVKDTVVSTTTDGIQWAGDVISKGWGHINDGYEFITQETVAGNWVYNTFKNAFVGDAWWDTGLKISGYVLGGGLCIISGGLGCAPLVIMALGDAASGLADTGAHFDWWSREAADWAKFGVGIAEIATLGWANIRKAGDLWGQMGTLKKIATFLGLNPDDLGQAFRNLFRGSTWTDLGAGLRNLLNLSDSDFRVFVDFLTGQSSRWNALRNALSYGEDAFKTLKTVFKFPGWYNKIKGWLEQLGIIDKPDDQGVSDPANPDPANLGTSADPRSPDRQESENVPGSSDTPITQEGPDPSDSETGELPVPRDEPELNNLPSANTHPVGTALPNLIRPTTPKASPDLRQSPKTRDVPKANEIPDLKKAPNRRQPPRMIPPPPVSSLPW